MQIPSSPTSKVEFLISTFVHDSTSTPSPFWAEYSFLTITLFIVKCEQNKGWIFQAGLLDDIIPSIRIWSHSTIEIKTGLKKS